MKAILTSLCLFILAACHKSEKGPEQKDAQRLDAAASDFKGRVERLASWKNEAAVFSDIKHDVIRTNSMTSPLKAEVTAKETITVNGKPSVYDLTLFAVFKDGEWRYDRCKGRLTTDGQEIKIDETSFKINSVYDLVDALRLKHDDSRYPQPKD
jgi:hypothetical protein